MLQPAPEFIVERDHINRGPHQMHLPLLDVHSDCYSLEIPANQFVEIAPRE
jgi:hypothetical protein